MHQVSYLHLCLWSTALAFLLFIFFHRHSVFTYSYMGSDTAMYEVLFSLMHPAYERVACLVSWNWMDVSTNTVKLRVHPTRGWGSPNNVCLVANACNNCPTRYDRRSEFGVSARERPAGRKRLVLLNSGHAGRTRRSLDREVLRQAAASSEKHGPAGQVHGSAENNSRIMVTRPASNPYPMGHDPTRPVTF